MTLLGPLGRYPLRGVAAVLLALAVAGVVWGWPRPQEAALPASRPSNQGNRWLRAERGRIVDTQGREVLLRGFNVDTLTDPTDAELGRPSPLDDRDAQLMRQAGFDSVRLPIAWSLLEPALHRFDGQYLERIAATVALLERQDLRVILDMHFGIGWGPRSEVPPWASVTWIPDWRPIHRKPWSESVSPRVAVDQGAFWLGNAWQHELGDAWQLIARRFRDDPGVVGYDIYNEPRPLPVPPGLFETRYLFPFYARMIASIGRVDPNHLFIVESPLFDDLPTTVERIQARNVVYSPHLYLGSLTETPFSESSPSSVAKRVEERAAEARAVGAALWFGEVGINHDQAGAAAFEDAYVKAMDQVGAGWSWWQWRQNGGWGIRDAAGTHVDRDALERLARPYVERAPIGVTAVPRPGDASLELRVRPAPVARQAVVSWPGLLDGVPAASGACLQGTAWDSSRAELAISVVPGRGCLVQVS